MMTQRALSAILLLSCCPFPAPAQRVRRAPANATIVAPPLAGVVVSFHGALKELSKKTILLATDDNQLVTLRRTSKTRFLDQSQQKIKADDIDLDDRVTIEAAEDNDLKLLATVVHVDPAPPKKPAELIRR